MSDIFCSCQKGRRQPDSLFYNCNCPDATTLPTVWLKGDQDVRTAEGVHCGLRWHIVVECTSETTADCTIFCADHPDSRLLTAVVSWITVHAAGPQLVVVTAQEICAALLWSRLRAGWLMEKGK